MYDQARIAGVNRNSPHKAGWMMTVKLNERMLSGVGVLK